jgi:NAD-dependent dihydropyrimidine dehydrogenase PreA subunit
MSFVIGAKCVDVNDRACTDVCPVDCIYVGDRRSYINPAECIDCGACEPECPAEAIFVDRSARDDDEKSLFIRDSRAFFSEILAGRSEPLGNPGGARKVGELGVDTEFTAQYQA